MAIRGQHNEESVTMTSVSQEPESGVQLTRVISIGPFVKIKVPIGNPVAAMTSYAIQFNWTDVANNLLSVADFTLDDVIVRFTDAETGVVTTIIPTNFQGNSDEYTMSVSLPNESFGRVEIEVIANSASSVGYGADLMQEQLDALFEQLGFSRFDQLNNYEFEFNTQGPPQDSTNRINSFQVDERVLDTDITGADRVCELIRDNNANEFLNDVIFHIPPNAGGAFNGVLEQVSIGNVIYAVIQIEKFRQTVDEMNVLTGANIIDRASQAGAVLMKIDLDTCTYTPIKTYLNISTAARSLVVNGNTVEFFEGSHYVYSEDVYFRKNRKYSSDPNEITNTESDTDITALTDEWKSRVGRLYRINHPSTTVELIGLNRRSATTEDNPEADTDLFYGIHGGTASPILSVDGDTHMITGFGDFEDILQYGEQPFDRIGNWNWIQASIVLNQRIPELLTNEKTGYDIIREVAIYTSSIIGFNKNRFFFQPRESRSARLMTTLPDNASSFDVIEYNRNHEIPSSGTLFVDGEIITYTGLSNNTISGLTRGDEGTVAKTHTVDITNDINPKVYWIDHLLSLNQRTIAQPINDISIDNDYRQLYNHIKLDYGGKVPISKKDRASILANREHILDISIPLGRHNAVWATLIAEKLLERFKDIHQIVEIILKPTFYMNVSDTVLIKLQDRVFLLHACQALSITQNLKNQTTSLKMVTL